jgi:hypothetical protein
MAAHKKAAKKKTTKKAGPKKNAGAMPDQGAIEHSFGIDMSKFDHRSTSAGFKGSNVGKEAMGAKAFAKEGSIAFSKGTSDMHIAAHEAAHTIQQRGGR